MIVRIQGEGQYRLDDAGIGELNKLDEQLEAALALDEASFAVALANIEGRVRELGAPLGDEELLESDVILPPSDATASEVREMLSDDGLIPG
ncbi:MAG: hypothetical protein K0U64_04615 [Actinomycetia bacterium]|nr:hypothetical protein [Actinomycetes bacterium]